MSSISSPILGFIFIGDLDAAHDEKLLKRIGVSVVVTCMTSLCSKKFEGVEYHHFQVDDHKSQKISKYFEKFSELCEDARKKKKKVLCHCRAGISRSTTMVISYLIFRGPVIIGALSDQSYFVFKRARELVSMSRYQSSPNIGFLRQLRDYASRVKWSPSKIYGRNRTTKRKVYEGNPPTVLDVFKNSMIRVGFVTKNDLFQAAKSINWDGTKKKRSEKEERLVSLLDGGIENGIFCGLGKGDIVTVTATKHSFCRQRETLKEKELETKIEEEVEEEPDNNQPDQPKRDVRRESTKSNISNITDVSDVSDTSSILSFHSNEGFKFPTYSSDEESFGMRFNIYKILAQLFSVWKEDDELKYAEGEDDVLVPEDQIAYYIFEFFSDRSKKEKLCKYDEIVQYLCTTHRNALRTSMNREYENKDAKPEFVDFLKDNFDSLILSPHSSGNLSPGESESSSSSHIAFLKPSDVVVTYRNPSDSVNLDSLDDVILFSFKFPFMHKFEHFQFPKYSRFVDPSKDLNRSSSSRIKGLMFGFSGDFSDIPGNLDETGFQGVTDPSIVEFFQKKKRMESFQRSQDPYLSSWKCFEILSDRKKSNSSEVFFEMTDVLVMKVKNLLRKYFNLRLFKYLFFKHEDGNNNNNELEEEQEGEELPEEEELFEDIRRTHQMRRLLRMLEKGIMDLLKLTINRGYDLLSQYYKLDGSRKKKMKMVEIFHRYYTFKLEKELMLQEVLVNLQMLPTILHKRYRDKLSDLYDEERVVRKEIENVLKGTFEPKRSGVEYGHIVTLRKPEPLCCGLPMIHFWKTQNVYQDELVKLLKKRNSYGLSELSQFRVKFETRLHSRFEPDVRKFILDRVDCQGFSGSGVYLLPEDEMELGIEGGDFEVVICGMNIHYRARGSLGVENYIYFFGSFQFQEIHQIHIKKVEEFFKVVLEEKDEK